MKGAKKRRGDIVKVEDMQKMNEKKSLRSERKDQEEKKKKEEEE